MNGLLILLAICRRENTDLRTARSMFFTNDSKIDTTERFKRVVVVVILWKYRNAHTATTYKNIKES